MSTYAKTLAEFDKQLNYTLQYIQPAQLGVGVENWPDLDQDFEARLKEMEARGLDFLGLWKMPLSEEWMGALESYCNENH